MQIKANSWPLFASSGSPLCYSRQVKAIPKKVLPDALPAHGFGTNPKPFCRLFPIILIYSVALLNLLRPTFKSRLTLHLAPLSPSYPARIFQKPWPLLLSFHSILCEDFIAMALTLITKRLPLTFRGRIPEKCAHHVDQREKLNQNPPQNLT